jgi:hypothetical protein
MGSVQIWREIKKIRDQSSQPKVINPKEEANKIAHHFATRADQQTLPEDRQQIVNMPTQIPLSHQTNWKQFYQQQKTPRLEKTKLHTYLLQISPLFQR